MRRSDDELNFSERERGSKSKKTLNFTRADGGGTEGNASSSCSISGLIGDVAGPETAKDKLKRKLLKKYDGAEILESWLREILAASLVGEILDLTFEPHRLRAQVKPPLPAVC